jgi:D-3-phosphoglycerate dehydrogenase
MKVAIFSSLWPDVVEQIKKEFDCTVAVNPDPETKHKVLSTANVVVVRSGVTLEKDSLEGAKHLKLIVRAGAGLDAIDVPTAERLGIRVQVLPLSADSVAELAFALLLGLCRQVVPLTVSLREGRWEKQKAIGSELADRTLGLFGFGRIATRIAEIANAFRMKVVAYDRSPDKPSKREAADRLGVTFATLPEMLKKSDYVIIQAPLNDDTRNAFDKSALAQMQPHAFLVNTGRGGIVNEEDLYEALKTKRLAGAALDVYRHEPPGKSPLFDLDNFIGTPHVGAQTSDTQRRVGEEVLNVIRKFAANGA